MSNVAAKADVTGAEIASLFAQQQEYFETGDTLSYDFRMERLLAFDAAIRAFETPIIEALHADLRRSETETWTTEIGIMLAEIRHMKKHLKRWMKPQRYTSALAAQPSMSRIHAQPLGQNLILGAWNYPVQLSLLPLVGCIAAGNTAVVKPSELAPNSSEVVAELIKHAFSPEHVSVVEGGVPVAQALLAQPWDHIFFTGGTEIGKIVAKAGAEHLSKVTLELGGKSPVIVGPSANIKVAARRILWGKFINAGQTCIAPDYVLAHHTIQAELVSEMKKVLVSFYGDDPQQSPDFCRIVNRRHFDRICGLIDSDKVAHGGNTDPSDLYIAPTLLTEVSFDDAVMGQEIFGPVLPIITIESVQDAVKLIRRNPNPLALYLFTENSADTKLITERVSFGGGCVNNTILHLSDPSLPFGGVRGSGQGAYHGKHSFDVFSHQKGVLHSNSANLLDLKVKYPPYLDNLKTIKRIL